MTGSAREVMATTKLSGIVHTKDDNGYQSGFRVGAAGAEAIDAALEQAGFAVVPVEPTEAMRLVANSKLAHEETATYRGVWQAMLSAARQQEAQDDG